MKKKILSLVMACALVFTTIIPVIADEASDVSFKIVHTNDVHSRSAGESYVSSYVKALKEDGENVFLVSAGDVLHGQPLATVSKGKAIVDIMNATGYDFLALGNHDFNYGMTRLNELVRMMNFEVLAANVTSATSNEAIFKQYSIREIDGIKIGFFGLSTPETATKTNPKNVVGVNFEDPAIIAENIVSALEKEGCDVIVAIVHLGLDEATLAHERSTAVAEVAGVDIVIDGHSHTVLENGLQVEGGALIAQTGEYLNNIGIVEVTVSGGSVTASASLIETPNADNPAWEPDQNVVAVIDKEEESNKAITSQVIGNTPVRLNGEREKVRAGETNLSALITSAMINETNADFAITNGGGIRDSIEAGDITMGDVLRVLPFGNFICTVDISGSAVIEALEHGLSAYPEAAGAFSQVGGMKVRFDSSKEAGSRVVSVTLDDGSALDPSKIYTVATNDFMAAGGDAYTMLNVTSGYIEYSALDEAVMNYISSGIDIAAIKADSFTDLAYSETPEEVEEVIVITERIESVEILSGASYIAKPVTSTIYIDGESVTFQSYNIANSDYFKLRDIAFVLNGSEKQFSVNWDAVNSVIALVSGHEYTATGSELSVTQTSDRETVSVDTELIVNGTSVNLTAFNINDYNYFNLGDLGEALGFDVESDENLTFIIMSGN